MVGLPHYSNVRPRTGNLVRLRRVYGGEKATVRDDDKVVIVAAGSAWPLYRLCGGYVCQPNRTFQDAGRMGFYSTRLIHGVAAKILEILPSVRLTYEEAARRTFSLNPAERRIGDIMSAALDDVWEESVQQVVVLSTAHEQATETFEAVVHNGANAWTMRQRYQSLDVLVSAKTTDDFPA
jgi:hypothetical protein